jgi:hypothetical protein
LKLTEEEIEIVIALVDECQRWSTPMQELKEKCQKTLVTLHKKPEKKAKVPRSWGYR